jgi:hypothetical protein
METNMNRQYALALLSAIPCEVPKEQWALIHALLYIGDQLEKSDDPT